MSRFYYVLRHKCTGRLYKANSWDPWSVPKMFPFYLAAYVWMRRNGLDLTDYEPVAVWLTDREPGAEFYTHTREALSDHAGKRD